MVNKTRDALTLSSLRLEIDRLARGRPAEPAGFAGLGHAAADRCLDRGLARGRLHEVMAVDPADGASAAGFVAMLARRLGGLILWVGPDGGPHAPGLREIGVDPAALVAVVAPDQGALLRAGEEAARCGGVGVAVVELGPERGRSATCDLTASRRLALAAEGSGTTVILLRVGTHPGREPGPSAARTRWGVRAAPSAPLAAGAPGAPTLDLTLLRRRGGAGGGPWRLEWNRDAAAFREPPLPGAVVPLPRHGPVEGERRRA